MTQKVEEVFPKLPPFAVTNAERQNQLGKRTGILGKCASARLDAILMKAREAFKCSVVILPRAVNISEDPLVAVDENVAVHFWNEIDRTVGVVAVAHA